VKRTALALLVLLTSTTTLGAQNKYGPLALTLPASARLGGMGNVGVAGRDDDVIFYNPAQLFIARGTSFSLTRLSATARGGTMSTVLRLGPGAFGFGVNYLEYQSPAFLYPVTRYQVLGRDLTVGTSTLGALGYAQVYKGFRIGATAKYAVDAKNLDRFGTVYGDLGVARELGRFTTALSFQNLGASLENGTEEVKAPMMTTLGVATARPLGPLDVAATAGVSYSLQDEVTGGGGAEAAWSWLSGYSIAVRAGAHSARLGGDPELMAGFGFTADRMTFDIAAERLPGNRPGYRAGIRIR
jgi:hypothetical protein